MDLNRSLAGIPGDPTAAYTQTMSKHVRIENPSSGLGFTSKKRAKQYVEDRRAEWVKTNVMIRLVESDRRVFAARTSADKTAAGYGAASATGIAGLAALANLPMSRPAIFLGIGKNTGASRNTFLATQGL